MSKQLIQTVTIKPVGDKCNLRCTYCFNDIPLSCSLKEPEDLLGVLDNIAIDKNVHFIISGGEPLLYPVEKMYHLILGIQKYCGDLSLVQIQTNGKLLNSNWLSCLKKLSSATKLNLSISFDPLLGNQRMECAEWQQCYDYILQALDIFPRLGIVSVVHKKNIKYINGFCGQLLRDGIRNVTVNKIREYPNRRVAELYITEEEYVDSLIQLSSWWLGGGFYSNISIQPLLALFFPETGRSCMYGAAPNICNRMCVVSSEGVQKGCENYFSSNLLKICEGCEIYSRCGGGCACCPHDEYFCEARKKLFRYIDGVMNAGS